MVLPCSSHTPMLGKHFTNPGLLFMSHVRFHLNTYGVMVNYYNTSTQKVDNLHIGDQHGLCSRSVKKQKTKPKTKASRDKQTKAVLILPSSELPGYHACMWYTYMPTPKIQIQRKWNKYLFQLKDNHSLVL